MTLPDGFTLDVNSRGRSHERLVVEIYYLRKYTATVIRETIGGPFEIEWDQETVPEYQCLKCPLDGFLLAIDAAKIRWRKISKRKNINLGVFSRIVARLQRFAFAIYVTPGSFSK